MHHTHRCCLIVCLIHSKNTDNHRECRCLGTGLQNVVKSVRSKDLTKMNKLNVLGSCGGHWINKSQERLCFYQAYGQQELRGGNWMSVVVERNANVDTSIIDGTLTIYGTSHDSAGSKSSEVGFVGLDSFIKPRAGGATQLGSFSARLCRLARGSQTVATLDWIQSCAFLNKISRKTQPDEVPFVLSLSIIMQNLVSTSFYFLMQQKAHIVYLCTMTQARSELVWEWTGWTLDTLGLS